MTETDERYPIGRFHMPEQITEEALRRAIDSIRQLPGRLREETAHLSEEQLDTPYREEGWTIRQVVHHCADSHANSLIRFKLALTEDNPRITPYHEGRWADLADSRSLPLESGLRMTEGVHERWAAILDAMTPEEFGRSFYHPQQDRSIRLDAATMMYAWHGEHHLQHIIGLKRRMGWE